MTRRQRQRTIREEHLLGAGFAIFTAPHQIRDPLSRHRAQTICLQCRDVHEQLGTFLRALLLGHDKTKTALLVPTHDPSLITHVLILVATGNLSMLPKTAAAQQRAADINVKTVNKRSLLPKGQSSWDTLMTSAMRLSIRSEVWCSVASAAAQASSRMVMA